MLTRSAVPDDFTHFLGAFLWGKFGGSGFTASAVECNCGWIFPVAEHSR
jgi:hypothetical protein